MSLKFISVNLSILLLSFTTIYAQKSKRCCHSGIPNRYPINNNYKCKEISQKNGNFDGMVKIPALRDLQSRSTDYKDL